MRKISTIMTGVILSVPWIARAEELSYSDISSQNLDMRQLIINIINWILMFAALLAVLFLIIGGIRYIISAGNPEQAGAAKKTILYAIIGLIVIILSYVIVNLIVSGGGEFLGGGGGGETPE